MTEHIMVNESKSAGKQVISLGKQHENLAVTVQFDVSAWTDAITPGGVFGVNVRRHGEGASYPCPITVDGTVVSMQARDIETEKDGSGFVELEYRVGDTVVRSATWKTYVQPSITDTTTEPPDPYESWVEHLTELGAQTEAHAQSASQSASAAETAKTGAESAATAAETAETNAANSATSASQFATSASQSADNADAAKTAAETAKTGAESAATAAETAETSAANSASSAAQSATSASQFATSAEEAAVSASNSAEAAEEASERYPYIRTVDNHWMVWDVAAGEYTDTGVVSRGDKGEPGEPGTDGSDGITPHIDSVTKHWMIGTTDTGIVAEGQNGEKGDKGDKGATGAQGQDGHTPVRGVDYWTSADKSEIVDDVISALPTYNGEVE